jgi:predicted metal-dependent hydrolase
MNEAAFQQAIKQFNAGEFFDCHETLEPLWLAAIGDDRTFLHGLIQAAAALHHHQRGNLKGAANVAQRAHEKLSLSSFSNEVCNESLAVFLEAFAAFFAATPPASYPQIQGDLWLRKSD